MSMRTNALVGSVAPFSLLFAALTALGCTTDDPGTSGVISELKSEAPRATPEHRAYVEASDDGRAFAFRFYAQLADDENLAFSPYSITTAAAMLSAGAGGSTLAQMRDALRFTLEGDAFHASQNALSLALAERNHEKNEVSSAQVLRSSNDFWMLPDLHPTNAFLDTLATYYGSGVHLADFIAAPERVRLEINGKVSSDTAGLIPELLAEGTVDSSTVFVLTNALYFKANWATVFSEEKTVPTPFQALDGSSTEVPMMRQTELLRYAADTVRGYQAVALPYTAWELEMVFLVPDEGQFEAVRADLTAESVDELVRGLANTHVNLGLPRFEVRTTVPLKDELVKAGMVDAFDPGLANFTPIADDIFISHAVHQAAVLVDEQGTEAAAATAFVAGRVSMPADPPIDLTIDRPFVFFLRDMATGAVLFVGQYVKP
jgi:serpin B